MYGNCVIAKLFRVVQKKYWAVSEFKEKFDTEHLYIAKGVILLLIDTVW